MSTTVDVPECACECHKTFRVGERISAYDWLGRPLGHGRVTMIQPPQFHGPYMKVLLDGVFPAVTVPMHTCKRLKKV